MMNPPRKPTRVEQTRKFFAPYAMLVIFMIGLVMGYIMGKI